MYKLLKKISRIHLDPQDFNFLNLNQNPQKYADLRQIINKKLQKLPKLKSDLLKKFDNSA